jgi:uncharacterized coiled-coil protein SlyX
MTDTKPITSLFASKKDLITAQARVKELEQQLATGKASPLSAQLATAQATITRLTAELTALKSRPLAVTPKATTAPTSATGGWQKPPGAPTMSKAEFDTMNPAQKMSFSKAGGKITN